MLGYASHARAVGTPRIVHVMSVSLSWVSAMYALSARSLHLSVPRVRLAGFPPLASPSVVFSAFLFVAVVAWCLWCCESELLIMILSWVSDFAFICSIMLCERTGLEAARSAAHIVDLGSISATCACCRVGG